MIEIVSAPSDTGNCGSSRFPIYYLSSYLSYLTRASLGMPPNFPDWKSW
jgi:hypothetical protein